MHVDEFLVNRAEALDRLRRVPLYQWSLAFLFISEGITKLSVWQSGTLLDIVINVVQLLVYALLTIRIIQNPPSKMTILFAVMSFLVFVGGYLTTRNAVFVRNLLLVLAAKDISFNSILKYLRWALSLVVLIALLTVAFGMGNMEVQRRGGVALGFVHPNQAALLLTMLLFLWIAEKRNHFTPDDFIVASLAVLMIYAITKSRTSFVLGILAMIVQVIATFKPTVKTNVPIKIALVLLPIACVLFTVLTAIILPYNNIANKIDTLLNNRVFLNWYAFEHHGVTLFGQIVNLNEGSGTVYNAIRGIGNSLITVDNSYTLSLVVLGVLPTFVFVAWLTLAEKKIGDTGSILLAFLGAVFCIYGLVEAQMIDVFNNYMMLIIFSSVSDTDPDDSKSVANYRPLHLKRTC